MANITNVVIACCDEEIRNVVKKGVSSVMGENRVKVCNSIYELHNLIKYEKNETAIIFDKYFLGYVVSYELVRIRFLNDKLLTYFVDLGDVSYYFGMRVHELGVDGFIPGIEDRDYFRKCVQMIQSGAKYYPESIQRAFEEKNHVEREFISEVKPVEMYIGLCISQGCNAKQICSFTGLSKASVSRYKKRLINKTGYSKPGDLEILNKRYFRRNPGDDNDSKD